MTFDAETVAALSRRLDQSAPADAVLVRAMWAVIADCRVALGPHRETIGNALQLAIDDHEHQATINRALKNPALATLIENHVTAATEIRAALERFQGIGK